VHLSETNKNKTKQKRGVISSPPLRRLVNPNSAKAVSMVAIDMIASDEQEIKSGLSHLWLIKSKIRLIMGRAA
jgi:hypothetical protein